MIRHSILTFLLLSTLVSITGCVKQTYKIDVPAAFNPSKYSYFNFPSFVEMNLAGKVIGTAAMPTYPYPTPYPAISYGGTISFTGNIDVYNEFYVVEKEVKQSTVLQCYNPGTGYFYDVNLIQGEKVSFIWNTDWLYPWIVNLSSNGIVDPLTEGDTITTIRIAANNGSKDFEVPQSSTNYTIVKYDQATGTVTPVANKNQQTPVIRAHSLVGIKEQFVYKNGGLYKVTLTLDVNNAADADGKGVTQQETNTVNLINKG